MKSVILVASIAVGVLLMASAPSYAASAVNYPALITSVAQTDNTAVPANEVIIGVGETAGNSYKDPTSSAFALEFRQDLSSRFSASVMYINEGHPLDWPKRDGMAVEGWYNIPLGSHRMRLSVGAGPYLYYSTAKHGTSFRDEHGIDMMVSLDMRYLVSKRVAIHLGWNRVTTWHDRDTDVFLIGFGYLF